VKRTTKLKIARIRVKKSRKPFLRPLPAPWRGRQRP
jgi:hypothetical protein